MRRYEAYGVKRNTVGNKKGWTVVVDPIYVG